MGNGVDAAAGAGDRAASRGAPVGPSFGLSSRLSMTPKRGEEKSDDFGYRDDEQRVYALSDGAARSFLPGVWAEILAEHVCHAWPAGPSADLRAWLAPARARWEEERRARTGDAGTAASGANWWLKTPGRPAGATLFAVSFRSSGDIWEYAAVMRGDTCGFHVRGGELLQAMPCRTPKDFTAHPECLMSIAEAKEAELRFDRDTALPGDLFFLATDALAKWILERCGAHEAPWERLRTLPPEELGAFANAQREANRMDEDDVSLLVIELGRPEGARGEGPPRASSGGGSSAPPPAGDVARRHDGAAHSSARATASRDREQDARSEQQRISEAKREAARAQGAPIHRGAARTWGSSRPAARAPAPAAPSGRQRPASTDHDDSPTNADVVPAAAAEPEAPRPEARSALRGRLIWSVLVPAGVSLVVVVLGLTIYALWHDGSGAPKGDTAQSASTPPPSPPAPLPSAPSATPPAPEPTAPVSPTPPKPPTKKGSGPALQPRKKPPVGPTGAGRELAPPPPASAPAQLAPSAPPAQAPPPAPPRSPSPAPSSPATRQNQGQ